VDENLVQQSNERCLDELIELVNISEESNLGTLTETIAKLDVSSSVLKVNDFSGDMSVIETSIVEQSLGENNKVSCLTSKPLELDLEPNVRSEVEQKPYNEMTWSEMWSLLLLADIPEGNYYPDPEKMLEIQCNTPFIIKKELIDAIVHLDGKTWSCKA
jgi:hypothetical protein